MSAEKGMPFRTVEARSGSTVWISGTRQDRPQGPTTECPFCPGGLEAPEPYDVAWFANRWPAMPDRRCEVVLFSPRHDATLGSLGVAGVRKVVDVWADRTCALGARDDVAYVLAFENRGSEAGATIEHPHGQIYAFEAVPPVALAELGGGSCPICDSLSDVGDRLVADLGGWRALVPAAARYPFEVLVAPASHVPDLATLDSAGRDGLAAALVDALGRLDDVFGAPMPYMLWVHQRPTDGGSWPRAHVHVEVAPLYRAPRTPRYVAAGEVGSGIWFNPLHPEDAARQLREAR
ncbi:MAG: galactose-1-phosphate uridylyltransferase [Acidimicrobiales bacterium]